MLPECHVSSDNKARPSRTKSDLSAWQHRAAAACCKCCSRTKLKVLSTHPARAPTKTHSTHPACGYRLIGNYFFVRRHFRINWIRPGSNCEYFSARFGFTSLSTCVVSSDDILEHIGEHRPSQRACHLVSNVLSADIVKVSQPIIQSMAQTQTSVSPIVVTCPCSISPLKTNSSSLITVSSASLMGSISYSLLKLSLKAVTAVVTLHANWGHASRTPTTSTAMLLSISASTFS